MRGAEIANVDDTSYVPSTTHQSAAHFSWQAVVIIIVGVAVRVGLGIHVADFCIDAALHVFDLLSIRVVPSAFSPSAQAALLTSGYACIATPRLLADAALSVASAVLRPAIVPNQ